MQTDAIRRSATETDRFTSAVAGWQIFVIHFRNYSPHTQTRICPAILPGWILAVLGHWKLFNPLKITRQYAAKGGFTRIPAIPPSTPAIFPSHAFFAKETDFKFKKIFGMYF